ncbi:MAG: helix-turn-helix domain-containing protein [Oscillospiraceae bacterium]|nr:helix-turn-helix domain-containing protein [Oscillospiraceae bacterium]
MHFGEEAKAVDEKILTIDELQDRLRIGRNQAYKLVADKKIKAFRTGKRWKITEAALNKYIRKSEESGKE